MCEMLGISVENKLPLCSFAFVDDFRKRGVIGDTRRFSSLDNPRSCDGWGIAFYLGKRATMIKEPLMASESALFRSLTDSGNGFPSITKSRIFILHLRQTISTSAPVSYENTHPFTHNLFGREYAFAHNGSIKSFAKGNGAFGSGIGRYQPVGATDSEYAMCYLLNRIRKRGIMDWDANGFIWLGEQLREIGEYGTFNCLFSEGDLLFAYRGKTEERTLYVSRLKHAPGYAVTRFDFIDRKYASRAEPLEKDTLMVLNKGRIVCKHTKRPTRQKMAMRQTI